MILLACLPRSGSTLFEQVLAQNPRFNVSGTSGFLDILVNNRNIWDKQDEFKANPKPDAKKRVMKAIYDSFYDTDKVVFDKSRGWLAYLEMVEEITGEKAKVLVTVRDVRDILASFEKLHREISKTSQSFLESNYFKAQTVQGRCELMLDGSQPLGIALNRIQDAMQRGFGDRMLLIDYDGLTVNPEMIMREVYKFIGEEYFEHDFNNVEQVINENDEVYGIKGLHDIRPKIEPMEPQWPKILGQWAKDYDKLNFWRQNGSNG